MKKVNLLKRLAATTLTLLLMVGAFSANVFTAAAATMAYTCEVSTTYDKNDNKQVVHKDWRDAKGRVIEEKRDFYYYIGQCLGME